MDASADVLFAISGDDSYTVPDKGKCAAFSNHFSVCSSHDVTECTVFGEYTMSTFGSYRLSRSNSSTRNMSCMKFVVTVYFSPRKYSTLHSADTGLESLQFTDIVS